MKTVTISENEYLNMQRTIEELRHKLSLLQEHISLSKRDLHSEMSQIDYHPVSLKRGSAKHIITYIADDFTAPLQDFQAYM